MKYLCQLLNLCAKKKKKVLHKVWTPVPTTNTAAAFIQVLLTSCMSCTLKLLIVQFGVY